MLLDKRDRSLFVLVASHPYGLRCRPLPEWGNANAHQISLDSIVGEQAPRKLGVAGKTRCEDPPHAFSKDNRSSMLVA